MSAASTEALTQQVAALEAAVRTLQAAVLTSSGVKGTYLNFAAAQADLGNIATRALVRVVVDETQPGFTSWYQKSDAGALVLVTKENLLAGQGAYPAGNSVTPSIRCTVDLDSGINLSGADQVQVVAGGNTQVQFQADGATVGAAFPKMSVSALGSFDGGNYRYAKHPLEAGSRGSFQAPNLYQNGVTWEFKGAEALGGQSGQFGGALTLAPFIGTSESTGGPHHQLGFRNDGAMLYRPGIDTTWAGWQRVLTDRIGPMFRGGLPLDTTDFMGGLLPGLYGYYPGSGPVHVSAPPVAYAYGWVQVLPGDVDGTQIIRVWEDNTNHNEYEITRYTSNAWSPWRTIRGCGNWNPQLKGATSGVKAYGPGNLGWWTKQGPLVTVGGTLSWSGGDALVGNVQLAGLPFPTNAINASLRGGGTLGGCDVGSFILASGYTDLAFIMDVGRPYAWVAQLSPGNGYNLAPGVGATGVAFGFTLQYLTDAV